MNEGSKLGRRELLTTAVTAGIVGGLSMSVQTLPAAAPATQSGTRKAMAVENKKSGTTDWQLTYTRIDPPTKWRCPWIEGYVSKASIKAGETLELFVSTNPAARFQVDLYRLGYYGGTGSRHLRTIGPLPGKVQAEPPEGEGRVRECRWEAATSFKIPADWPSGVYLGKLSLLDADKPEGRYQSYVVFIVRDERPADIVFQCSDNTWQAYNRWPKNNSLYDDGTKEWNLIAGPRATYDRPYGKYCQIMDNPLSQGSGEFLLWEFPFAFWLEQHGYDVTYISNTDVHASSDCLTRGKIMLSVGHDEYWSLEQFQHVKQAVQAGVSVGFFSGNTCCFVAPFSPSSSGVPNRILTRAGRYGGLTEEEKQQMGPFPLEGPNENTLLGARTVSPFNGSGDWTCALPQHWLFKGTNMEKGESIPGLVGWEFHGDPAKIPGLEVVAEGKTINGGGKPAHYTATVYPGPKGNFVFSASTIFWAQGLSQPPGHMPPISHFGRPHGPDERVQKITANFLAKCGANGAG